MTTTPTTPADLQDTGSMSTVSSSRGDGPRRRRRFIAADKLAHVTVYEAACETGTYLRTEGQYNSQIQEWRRLRDAGHSPTP